MESAPQLPLRDGFSRGRAAGVDVQWQVTGDQITVQMNAPTTGWVVVGFDPASMMAEANMIIGYVENGTLTIADDSGDPRLVYDGTVDARYTAAPPFLLARFASTG